MRGTQVVFGGLLAAVKGARTRLRERRERRENPETLASSSQTLDGEDEPHTLACEGKGAG